MSDCKFKEDVTLESLILVVKFLQDTIDKVRANQQHLNNFVMRFEARICDLENECDDCDEHNDNYDEECKDRIENEFSLEERIESFYEWMKKLKRQKA